MPGTLLALCATALAAAPADPAGTTPPEWQAEHWMHSTPLTLAGLRGKVVLVRWWTGPDCPMCSGSAPVLVKWAENFRERGLVVVGLYHHKARGDFDPAHVAALARKFGFTFPVAIDPGWRTLRAWWLDGHDRDYTSASFLIGRDGRIAHVHTGGTIDLADARGKALAAALEAALAK